MELAVNGTLMRGLELNRNLLDVGARFVREAKTDNAYRLYSINDRHPAMYRVAKGDGRQIEVEIWELDGDGIASVLEKEPPGLCVGKVVLSDGSIVLGVLGEPHIFEGQKDITNYGGWRHYAGELAQ